MVVKVAVVAVLGAVLLAYYCNEPVPEDIPQPMAYALSGIAVRTAQHLGRIGKYIGLGSEPQIIRDTLQAMVYLDRILRGGSKDGLTCTDTTFNGVPVRVYVPVTATQSNNRGPGLVYIHGGGWTTLNVDAYDKYTAHLAKQLGIVVVSVDYRLAPEHKFPAAFDDSIAATKFFLQNAEKYNVDSARIGISGDSAGGNLAAAVTLALAKENNLPKLKTQALIYPVLQALDFKTPSYLKNGHLNTLHIDLMIQFWLWYLNDDVSLREVFKANNHTSDQLKKSQYAGYVDHKMVQPNLQPKVITIVKNDDIKFPDIPNIATILDPRFAPLMADDSDLKGLPPTYMLTCEYDVLRDDGIMYAKRLEKAGVEVKHDHYETGFHGLLDLFDEFEIPATAMENLVRYLKENI